MTVDLTNHQNQTKNKTNLIRFSWSEIMINRTLDKRIADGYSTENTQNPEKDHSEYTFSIVTEC